MKKILPQLLAFLISSAITQSVFSQNVILNMLVNNAGIIPLNGNGTIEATINATVGTGGQTTPVGIGKINLQISAPPSVAIATVQNNLPAGWTIRNNNGSVINICNSAATIPINTAVVIPLTLQGLTVTTGAPALSGQLSFRTNCTGPGSLAGDNPSDNGSQAGYIVEDVLPIKLHSFTVATSNCLPILNWATENEINSSKFEIERTTSQLTANSWTKIGEINANRNSTSRIAYRFTDNAVVANTARILYRIKMIDADGTFKYSPIVAVFINCFKNELFAYPNPVKNGQVQVNITGTSTNTPAEIYSIAGQRLLTTNLINGTNTLNVSSLSNGTYILSVKFANGESKKIKLLVQQ
jgi:hypothetical protein